MPDYTEKQDQAILVRDMETVRVMTPFLPDDERAQRLARLREGEIQLTDAEKLGVSFYQYVYDRVSRAHAIPSLADLIRQRAEQLNLGASWNLP